MGDNGIASPPAKKREASRQLTKDDGSDSDSASHESGSFRKASEEVLSTRRIVKVRCTATPSTSAANPFASIRLVLPSVAADLPPASSTPVIPPVPELDHSSGTSECEVSLNAVSTAQAGSEERDINNLDTTAIQKEVGRDVDNKSKTEVTREVDVPEEIDSIKSDGGGEGKAGDGAPVETVEDVKPSAMPQGEDKMGTVKPVATVEECAGNEVGGEDQHDAEAENETGDVKVQRVDDPSAQSGTVAEHKTAFTSSLGSGQTPFSSSSFSFGTAPSSLGTPTGFASFCSTWAFGAGSASQAGSGTAFALKAGGDGPFCPSTGFGNSNGTTFQLFSSQMSATSSVAPIAPSFPSTAGSLSFQEVPLETGEEREKVVFAADATLFEFADCAWKERGKGELKVNVSEDTGPRARLLMRSKGNYRLLLNASLFPDMKMTSMDSRGVIFVCVNSATEGKVGLTTYAVKLKDSLAAEGFREAVDAHKGNPHIEMKTPENSPRALHDPVRDAESNEP